MENNFNKSYKQELQKVSEYFCNLHDNGVNQKYGNLPYSFHIESSVQQLIKIRQIVLSEWYNQNYSFLDNESLNKYLTNDSYFQFLLAAMYGHDSIEDGRLTYNDCIKLYIDFGFSNEEAIFISDLIYAVTDEKGKTRKERKNEKFYSELFVNEQAVLIKFADMLANLLQTITFDSKSIKNKEKEFKYFTEIMPSELREKYFKILFYISGLYSLHHYEK